MPKLDILIIGAGWTATFLIPLLQERKISFAATTRDGRSVAGVETIAWSFDPESNDDGEKSQFAKLPAAAHVLITFPLTGLGQSSKLITGYEKAHGMQRHDVHFIQLGSTGIWQISQSSIWINRKSPYDTTNKRAVAEDELLSHGGCVLNLAGLWGGPRNPGDWVERVAKTKEDVRNKKSLHLVHGLDVARAIVAVVGNWKLAQGERFMLTDGFVYDWWSLFAGWADRKNTEGSASREPSQQAKWVYELLREDDIPALPRSMEALGRCYDGRDFWHIFSTVPLKARV
jgi:hypothetical protein